jgi:hypothetical protein
MTDSGYIGFSDIANLQQQGPQSCQHIFILAKLHAPSWLHVMEATIPNWQWSVLQSLLLLIMGIKSFLSRAFPITTGCSTARRR